MPVIPPLEEEVPPPFANSLQFKDELVKEGLEGGKRTANLLRNAVQKELTSSLGVSHHLQIHVRVYTNIKGQAKTYKEMGIIPEATDKLLDFIRGFDMGDPLFDFVDAGNGKECADVKVKGILHHTCSESNA